MSLVRAALIRMAVLSRHFALRIRTYLVRTLYRLRVSHKGATRLAFLRLLKISGAVPSTASVFLARGVASGTPAHRAAIARACNRNAVPYFGRSGIRCMAYQTTLGWSLFTSGLVTLLLFALPGKSLWWGIGLLLVGLAILYIRRNDVSDAILVGS